ncbi:MAG: hypothetical protein ACR2OW_03575, partial [Methyloligellaceae bacterium]
MKEEISKEERKKDQNDTPESSDDLTVPISNIVSQSSISNVAEQAAIEEKTNAKHRLAEMRHNRDNIRRIFETGEYPYKRKITRKAYEKHKAELQVELLKVQEWV